MKPSAVLVHGFAGHSEHMSIWARMLAKRGYETSSFWYRSAFGNWDSISRRFAAVVEARQPELIIGWSFGGLFANEHAQTSAVITLGSPFQRELSPWKHVPGCGILKAAKGQVADDSVFVVEGTRDLIVPPSGDADFEVVATHFGLVTRERVVENVYTEWERLRGGQP